MTQTSDTQTLKKSQNLMVWAGAVGRSLLRIGSSGFTRVVLIVLSVAVVFWLLFIKVWQPLHQEITLPAGISLQNPQLDAATLQQINTDRSQRTVYTPRMLESINRQFIVPGPSIAPL